MTLHRRSYVSGQNLDGNRKLQHHRQPDRFQVSLGQNTGFFVDAEDFSRYRANAKINREVRQIKLVTINLTPHCATQPAKATCHNHRAAAGRVINRPGLDVQGVGLCSCHRHGCVYPNGVVDFPAGEQ
jgi:hypothetical protein